MGPAAALAVAALNISLFSYRSLLQKLPELNISLRKLGPPLFPRLIPATAWGNSLSLKSRTPTHQTRSCNWCSLEKPRAPPQELRSLKSSKPFCCCQHQIRSQPQLCGRHGATHRAAAATEPVAGKLLLPKRWEGSPPHPPGWRKPAFTLRLQQVTPRR